MMTANRITDLAGRLYAVSRSHDGALNVRRAKDLLCLCKCIEAAVTAHLTIIEPRDLTGGAGEEEKSLPRSGAAQDPEKT